MSLSLIKSIAIIVGPILTFLGLLRYYVLPHIIRRWLKPNIEVSHTLGDAEDVRSLFTSRKAILWIHNRSNRNLELKSIGYRRICRFQNKCLLFDYFRKTKAISNMDWCPCSSVTDWSFEVEGFRLPSEEEGKQILQQFASNGVFQLTPSYGNIPPKMWRPFGLPFKLRIGKPHLIDITISSEFNSEEAPILLRALYRLVNPTSRGFSGAHTVVIRVVLDLCEGKKLKGTSARIQDISGEYFAIYAYLLRPERMEELLTNLNNEFIAFMKQTYPLKELKTEDVLKSLKNVQGQRNKDIDILSRHSPEAKRTTTSINGFRAIIRVWSPFRDFCKEFLDCEQYAKLMPLFTEYLLHPHAAKILHHTYSYILVSSHSPTVGLMVNLKKRTKSWPIVLFCGLRHEGRLLISEVRTKRRIKREVSTVAETVKRLRAST